MYSLIKTSIVSLVAFSLGTQVVSAHPLFIEERAGNGCNADNVLRSFRSEKNLGAALSFCSAFLDLPQITYTSIVATSTATVTSTSTSVSFEKRAATSTPAFVATVPASRISSACNCLTIPLASTTITATSGVATVTATVTATSTQSRIVLASPTAIAGAGVDGTPAPYDQDDTYYPVDLPFNVKLFSQSSSRIFVSINGLVWLDELAVGDFQEYYTGSPNARLPLDSTILPDVSILPFWADLIIKEGTKQGIYYAVSGTAGSRQVTVEYFVSLLDTNDIYHFAVTAYEAQSKIRVDYYNIPSKVGTVGLQQYSTNDYIQFGGAKSGTYVVFDYSGNARTFTTGNL